MALLQLVIGVLVLVSPWVLGMGEAVITWTNGALGVLLILAALWQIVVRNNDHGGVNTI